MEYETREIPWDKVVNFHKEIASRAEESFFSLIVDDDGDRWSSINRFEMNSLSGPWYVNKGDMVNKDLERSIKQETLSEIFIGGPCWFKWSKGTNKNFIPKWQPLLYKEVKIKQLDNGSYHIVPEQGKWEISPLVYSLVDRKGIVPIKPLDILIPEILEKAESILEYEKIDLATSIIKVLTSYIPELSEELKKVFPVTIAKEKPSDWIIFVAPANFSSITQNLMADYNSLSNILNEDRNNIGGLKLLNDVVSYNTVKENIDILPIIPLNNNQCKSVEGILENNPVTVISGPPGCGKSQVVLSVLLNAWSNGKSVLFASNNNQAVDVIKSRLEQFEIDFPIAVRAGAKKVSNLEETLRRTKNILTNYGDKSTDINDCKIKQENLVDEKNQIETLIASKLPERIDQSIKSAINAYSNYIKSKELLNDRENKLRIELADIGFNGEIKSFKKEIVEPSYKWLEELDEKKALISENRLKSKALAEEINGLIIDRNKVFKDSNLENNFEVNLPWLSDLDQLYEFEKWYKEFKDILRKPIEKDIIDIQWKAELRNWNSVEEVLNWRNDVKNAQDELEMFYKKENFKLKNIKESESTLHKRCDELNKLGLNEVKDISLDKLEQWLNEYKLLTIMPNKKLDFLPWSEKSKKLKLLSEIEKYLISKIPLKIWNIIGSLNDTSREKLSEYVESLYNWKLELNKWNDYKKDIIQLEEGFSIINKSISNIKIEQITNILDISEESRVKQDIERLYKISEDAIILLEKKERMDNATSILINTSNDFKGTAIGIPIREAWINSDGKQFNDAITGLASYIEKEDIIYLRQFTYEGHIDNLISKWKKLINIQQEINSKKILIENIVDDKIIIDPWLGKRPRIKLFNKLTHDNVLKNEETILLAIDKCKELELKCSEFSNIIKPEEEVKIEEELRWARNKIKDTINIIDNKEKRVKIEEKLLGLIEKEDSWDIDKIIYQLEDYNLEKLKAKIEVLNGAIEEVSFEIGKAKRIGNLSNNIEVQDLLDSLLNHYLRNHGRINKNGYEMFREALKAIPVWITTAQSPQAIPMEAELFDILVIDEATQCTLTNILPLIYRCKSIAVIGDPQQLTAIPTISESGEVALGEKYKISEWIDIVGHVNNNVYKSAVRCLPKRSSDIINLNEHYRSHPLIIGFSNLKVYQSNLKLKKIIDNNKEIQNKFGVYGIKVSGYCEKGPKNDSWINESEAKQVCELIKLIKLDKNFKDKSVGVVTPFKAQVQIIADIIDNEGLTGITVDTVHKYQGDERDIMIFSPVVSRGISEGAIRWIENPPNLINVAVTRAKDVFYVVGNIDECSKQKGILGELARYVETITLLRETSEYELRMYSLMILQGLAPEVHVNIKDIEVDFVIKNNKKGIKIVVEIDGSQHKTSKIEDESRDAFLKARGYKVLRFATREIDEIPAEVINKIINEYDGF